MFNKSITIKENLIFALESAEYEGNEVEIYYEIGRDFSVSVKIKPDTWERGNEMVINDIELGNDFQMTVMLNGNIQYNRNDNEEEYIVPLGSGSLRFVFR